MNKKNNIKLTLKNIELADMQDLFEWRNHIKVRKNSFNTNPISWDEHVKWFKKKIKDKKSTIYIAYNKNNEKVGIIRFDEMEEIIKTNIMLNPVFIGKGFGSKILSLATKKILSEKKVIKPIIAEVKNKNIASIKTFIKAGFKEEYITFCYKK